MSAILSIWTIYDRPRDYPDCFVARRYEIEQDGPRATQEAICSTDIEKLRDEMQRRGLVKLMRHTDDEAHIVENWI